MATETHYPRRTRARLEKVIPQLDRAVPLKVRAYQGTSEGSSAEVFMLGYINTPSREGRTENLGNVI